MTLDTVLRAAMRATTATIHTSIPGVVISYDRATQTATVRPVVADRMVTADGEAHVDAPELPGVPVAFPSGGGVSISWDLAAGDTVVLVFAHRSIDEWKLTAEDRVEADDPRRHSVSDAIAIPGGMSPASPIPSAGLAAGALVVRADDLRLGSASAADYVALASLVEAQLTVLKTAITNAIPGAADGGAALKTAILGGLVDWPSSVGASKVRAE